MNFSTEQLPVSERLLFRLPTSNDAGFYRKLMNEPDYIRFISDQGIRTDEDAISYIEDKSLSRFAKYGVGLWVVETRDTKTPIGVCGLVVRDELDCPDLGYGFLQDYRGKGYAREAGQAVLDFAREHLDVRLLCAITDPENTRSSGLLKKVGFVYEGQRHLAEIGATSDYFVWKSE